MGKKHENVFPTLIIVIIIINIIIIIINIIIIIIIIFIIIIITIIIIMITICFVFNPFFKCIYCFISPYFLFFYATA